ncbi:putative repeat protein (TIGR01451 family) [Variovorax boronicumulans]|nr:hypothetical protein [Variovorax boronicumulans]MDP9908114.1 putative repeat protein (TIGR01451 family) [Variovorax boronicumulans]
MPLLLSSSRAGMPRWWGCGALARSAMAAFGLALATAVALAMFFAPIVQAAPAPGGVVIRSIATGTYVPAGLDRSETVISNAVTASVLPVEALSLTQDQRVNRPPGTVVTLSHLLTNTGNVASRYTLGLVNDGAGCPAGGLDLSALRVARDANHNGVVDASDPVLLPGGAAGALALEPGQTAELLVQGTIPTAASGSACVVLSATTALQGASASNRDTVDVGSVAVLALVKSASHAGAVVPGSTRIDFSISGTNTGARDAQPGGAAAPTGTQVLVNGSPRSLLLLRDLVPTGTRYLAGSLQSTAAGAVRLFRMPGDADFSYRTAEDGAAIEVAIGVPTALARNASIAMQFAVQVKADHTGDIRNTAHSQYNDGVAPAASPSNTVVIALAPPQGQGRIGVAKAASTPRMHRGADGQPDGTATVTFDVHVRNYGTTALHGVQLADVLEGQGATQFGTRTTAAVPGARQYAVVPGTLAIVGGSGNGVAGTVAAVNAAFNGTAFAQDLLSPGAVLPVGGQFTVRFDVRFHVSGRAGTLLNTVRAQAALAAGGPPTVFDDSVNGSNPDADGDGNPGSDTSPTPVQLQQPVLSLVKSVSQPRRVGEGVYELDYRFKVGNTGAAPAPSVRVIDNLDCTFDMDKPEGLVAAWELVGAPKARHGVLQIASGFTGRAACDREAAASADPFKLPMQAALGLTDGSRALAPGQSEDIEFTVRVTRKSSSNGARVPFTNKAWAAAFEQNTAPASSAALVTASASSASSMLADPQGVVYNAVTRQPVAGAVVTFTRQSCSDGAARPMALAEVFGGDSGVYRANADGSLSMTTGADGGYQFYFLSPPVTGSCTYALGVAPPAGSAYAAPSQLIPATPGTFDRCGAIVPNAASPQGAESTTHHFSLKAGFEPSGAACDVLHNHIPLDPGNVLGLVLRKEGSKRQVEFGDFLDYALVVTNKTGFPVTGLSLSDQLPPGFAYVAGSARLNGAATADPVGGAGPRLVFNQPGLALGIDQSATVRYRVRVGVGAPTNGDAVNRARASSGPMQSNLAQWTVRVTGGVFSDDAFLFGKVYMDCRRDGRQQGVDEIGVPGVRLYMEDGTHVITDVEGKWSLYGLKPVTHVLRLDATTLPAGARLEALDNRNAGRPDSRFVDLKKGEFHKANFVVANCDAPAVMSDVIAAVPDTEAEAQVRMRLDPEGRIVPVGDRRALPASGEVRAGGSTGTSTTQASSAPLIAMPAAPASPSSFIGGASGGQGSTLGAATGGAAADGASPVGSLFTGMRVSRGIAQPTAAAAPPQAAPSPIDLEALLPRIESNALGFIDLRDGDTLPSTSLNVRVKGEAGLALRLSVNGQGVEERRVGKKTEQASRRIGAWEYIGIVLRPGANRLVLEAVDPFGNVRGAAQQISVTAPDKLGAIHIDVPASAQADLRTPVVVKVRLTDAAGVPVTARTQLTLETDRGRWLDEDLNPAEPGTQVFMDGGVADFRLLPPGEPGDARLRVTAASFTSEARLALLPELRPMIGVGIVEGVLDFTKRGQVPLGAMPAGAAFEAELSGLADEGNDKRRAAARAAFFFKGAVKGEYLLTAAYDSDKTRKDRLFRDIRPDEFYPVYGDSSAKGFDAQSTQKLYVRIDKNRSYLLYGDFSTASSTEVRSLSQVSRSLTGLKHVYDDGEVRTTTYASRTAQTQQVEEFRAVGTSGPYYLGARGGEFVENSEQVEIVVRDRNQPDLVLQRSTVTRFVDYTVEPLTRRLLFTRAIASVDANLNPQSIRVTYKVDAGGPKFTVAGADVQLKVAKNLQVGVVAAIDENPENRRKLGAVTAMARLGEHTTVAGEWVQTDSDRNGKGSGARVELRHQGEDLAVAALASKTSTGFDNPGASFSAGRTEASARAEYRLDAATALRGELLYGQDALREGTRRGITASVQRKFGEQLVGEFGLRHGHNGTGLGSGSGFDYGQVSSYSGNLGSGVAANNVTALGAAANAGTQANANDDDLTTVRARLSAQVPGLPQANVFIEGEQDLRKSDRHVLAVGGNYAVTDKTRLYGRYELVSSLYGPYELNAGQSNNVGILGIESAYMEGGRVYSEYRLADSLDGRAAQAATGVRNTFRVDDHWRLTGGVEHTRQIGGLRNSGNNGTGHASGLAGDSTAITGGVEYTDARIKASGILEGRHGDDADTRLFSAGFGFKIDASWSLLARSVMSASEGQGANSGNAHHLARHQLGLAYRPVDTDSWNALMRYERRSERVTGTGSSTGALDGASVFGAGNGSAALPGRTSADIVSAHLNYNPRPGTVINGRYAAKWSRADDGVLRSTYWAHLLQARYTQDLNDSWDLGVQAGLLRGKGGGLQKTLGIEVGYQVMKDLWVSAGYNFVGLKDRDLAANDYTSKGAYIRLRFKFDETALGAASAGAAAPVKDERTDR